MDRRPVLLDGDAERGAGQAGQAYVREHFDWDACLQRLGQQLGAGHAAAPAGDPIGRVVSR